MQREGKGWAKGIAKASYGAVYANVVREHGTFVDATGARIGDRNAKKAVLRWQRSLEAGLQPPVGAPYNLAQNETVTRETGDRPPGIGCSMTCTGSQGFAPDMQS